MKITTVDTIPGPKPKGTMLSTNLVLSGITTLAGFISGTAVILVLGHLLPVPVFGEVTYAYTFASLALLIPTYGFPLMVVRDIALKRLSPPKAIVNILTAQIFLAVITMLGLAIYAWVSKLSTSLYPVLFIFVVSGLLNAFSIVISAVNKGLNDFTVEAKVSSFYSLLLIFFLAGAYFVFPRTSMTVGLCMLLSNALEFGAALLLVKPMMQTETGILPSHTIVRDLLKFGLPFALNLILATLYFQIDTLIVGQILNLEEVGFYQAAIRLVMATIPVAMILINAFYPRLVRAYDPEARKFITSDHQKMLAALLVLGIAGAILFNILAQPIINLIYGPKMLASVPILQIFALVLVFRFMAGGYAVLLIARGQQIVLVWAAGSATVVNVVLNLVLIPRFGIAGSAWVNVITNLLILLIYLVAFHNKRHVPLWGFRGAA